MINLPLAAYLLIRLAEEPVATESIFTALIIPLIVVVILVVLNGFFVAAEFAILGSRPSRMEELADDGESRAQAVLDVLEDPDRQNAYLATAQLGITVVTLGLAMYAEPRIAHNLVEPLLARLPQLDAGDALIHTLGYVISLGVLTYLHVVIGEMIPKSLALTKPTRVSIQLARPMSWLNKLLYVPILLLNGIGDALLRLFRIPPAHGTARLYSPEEIEQIVSESREGGLITEGAEAMVSNIFDFHDRAVGQIMTPRRKVEGISVTTPYADLVRLVARSRHSRFPVYNGDLDHIVGILHLKDLALHYRESNEPVDLRQLVRPTPVVPEDHSVVELLKAFKLQRIHMAIVLDEYGGVAGIVTLEDLVEEVVGEVRDEFDMEREPYVEIEPGIIELAGSYLLDSLKDQVFIGEDEDLPDVDTVGGLVVTHLGRPPEIGDRVELPGNVSFQVVGVEGRAVTRVRVEYPALTDEQEPVEDQEG